MYIYISIYIYTYTHTHTHTVNSIYIQEHIIKAECIVCKEDQSYRVNRVTTRFDVAARAVTWFM